MPVTVVSRGAGGMAAIFLDKDRTVRRDDADPALMHLAPGAHEGLRLLGELACPLIVVSNQDGASHGSSEASALGAVRRRLDVLFAENGASLTSFHYCPHPPVPTSGCGCRRPAPGLLMQAAHQNGVNPQRSWLIGGMLDDIEAGHRAGCRSVLVDDGARIEVRTEELLRQPYARAADLAGAARLVAAAWVIWSGAR